MLLLDGFLSALVDLKSVIVPIAFCCLLFANISMQACKVLRDGTVLCNVHVVFVHGDVHSLNILWQCYFQSESQEHLEWMLLKAGDMVFAYRPD